MFTRNPCRILPTVGAFAASLAILANPGSAQSQPSTEKAHMIERTVSVSATGQASAAPDMATISTGVQAEAATAREAMAANSAAMGKLIDGLKAAGIDSKDIRTTSININPRYGEPRPGKPPVINGYYAQNQVRITVRDLKKLGDLLDTALTLGATQMGGISFDISNAEMLRDEARKAAMINARRRAELYATAAGVALGDVLSISESEPSIQPQVTRGRAVAMSAASVPVEAGELELNATIHVTWSLR